MKRSIYLETTIISYLAARPANDPISLMRQTITRDWWQLRRSDFEPIISDIVLQEIQRGDADAALRRLEMVKDIPALPVTEESVRLSELLVTDGPIPAGYPEDVLHIALCAVNSIEFLLTWNCTHIANAAIRYELEVHIDRMGYDCPIICTPEELMESLS